MMMMMMVLVVWWLVLKPISLDQPFAKSGSGCTACQLFVTESLSNELHLTHKRAT